MVAEYVPAAQDWQVFTEAIAVPVLNLPAGHAVHVAADVAPTTSEYVPEIHGPQVPARLAPVVMEKVPAMHGMH